MSTRRPHLRTCGWARGSRACSDLRRASSSNTIHARKRSSVWRQRFDARASALELVAPVPAMEQVVPALVLDHAACAHAMTCHAPAPEGEHVAPTHAIRTATCGSSALRAPSCRTNWLFIVGPSFSSATLISPSSSRACCALEVRSRTEQHLRCLDAAVKADRTVLGLSHPLQPCRRSRQHAKSCCAQVALDDEVSVKALPRSWWRWWMRSMSFNP